MAKPHESAVADLQWEMARLSRDMRCNAAAEIFSRVLSQTPDQYQDPWLRNALRDGIETTLGLKELSEEGGL